MDGYRSLTIMMLDGDIVAFAPSTTYRALKDAGLISRTSGKPSSYGHRLCATYRTA
jgi:hypothetical protein